MMDFFARKGPNLGGGKFCHRHGRAVESGELNHEAFAAFVNMDDGPHIARCEAVLGQIGGQRHTIKFGDHCGKG